MAGSRTARDLAAAVRLVRTAASVLFEVAVVIWLDRHVPWHLVAGSWMLLRGAGCFAHLRLGYYRRRREEARARLYEKVARNELAEAELAALRSGVAEAVTFRLTHLSARLEVTGRSVTLHPARLRSEGFDADGARLYDFTRDVPSEGLTEADVAIELPRLGDVGWDTVATLSEWCERGIAVTAVLDCDRPTSQLRAVTLSDGLTTLNLTVQ